MNTFENHTGSNQRVFFICQNCKSNASIILKGKCCKIFKDYHFENGTRYFEEIQRTRISFFITWDKLFYDFHKSFFLLLKLTGHIFVIFFL